MTFFKKSLVARSLALAGGASLLFASVSTQAAQSPAAYMMATRYNAKHQVTGTISPSVDGSTYLATRNLYNLRGLLARAEQGWLTAWMDESRDPASYWTNYFHLVQATTYTYDDLGRKATEAVVAADGTVAMLTQYSYDAFNQVTCKALRMNSATESVPTDACTLSATSGTEAQDRISKFAYNGIGQVLTETRAYGTALQQTYVNNTYTGGLLSDVTDANANRTHLTYDTMSRLATMKFPSPTSAGQVNDNDYEQYGYDGNGNRTSLRKRDGRTIQYDFDALNRVVDEIYPASTIANVYYGYDLRGLKLFARFGSTTGAGLTNTYDGFGLVATASTNQSGAARTLTYQYDADGNRTRVTHPDSAYFQYSYDGLNRLGTIKENGATLVIAQSYDSAGRRGSLQRGANVAATSFLYDGVSRIKTLSQDLQGTGYDETRGFDYNAANQLVSKSLSNSVYQYSQAPNVTTSYKVNGLNQYTQFTAGASASTSYDANGNMTSDGSSTFAYDVMNRMTSANGAKRATLTYDPLGRLFQTSAGASGTTQYLYDSGVLVAEYDASGSLVRRYVHGSGVDEPLVSYEGGSVGNASRRYFHADQQGSVIAVIDAAGNMLQPQSYGAYGEPATGNVSRFQYTGQILLPDLGQYYYKARIYNPTIGRFMQVDPIGYKDDLNLYSYVGGDPANRSDPSGLAGCDASMDASLCSAAKDAQAQARKDIKVVTQALENLSKERAAVDSGTQKELSSSAKSTEAALEKQFGSSSDYAIASVSYHIGRIDDVLADKGDNYKMDHKDLKGILGKANPFGSTITLGASFAGASPRDKVVTLLHEPGHMVNLAGDFGYEGRSSNLWSIFRLGNADDVAIFTHNVGSRDK